MADGVHPLALEHLPVFVAGPDGGAVVFTATAVGVLVGVVIRGPLDFRPHAPPEMTAHRANRARYQLIAILAPLALFTPNGLFWVAALLLAASKLADLATPLDAIARSLEHPARGDHAGCASCSRARG